MKPSMRQPRPCLTLICGLALFATICSPPAVAADAAPNSKGGQQRPNVLFLMSDDLRPDLGCYGQSQVVSPNIDKLAAEGVKFSKAYVQYPLCNPSRTSLLSGRYPSTNGVLDNTTWFGALHPDWKSLPRFFKDNGYASLRTGKIFHGGIDDADAWTAGGEERKFEGAVNINRKRPANRQQMSDRIVVLEGDGESHGDYRAASKAIEFLKEYRDRPFFLACGFTKPHSPPTAPQRFFDLYDVSRIPLPPDFASAPKAPEGFPPASVTPNGDLFIKREASRQEAQEMIRAYWASTSFTDWNVGRVLNELDRLGLRDNTIVLFWGDHGYHLGEKGKWAKHGSLFEIGTRVPLIIHAPGMNGNGTACDRVVETLDLYPTLAELCGLPIPTGLEGDSLVSLLEDPDAKWNRPAVSMIGNADRGVTGVAIRTDKYRYAEIAGDNGGRMLFDEQADPHEMKNLADDLQYADMIKRLHNQAGKYLGPVNAGETNADLKPAQKKNAASDQAGQKKRANKAGEK